MRVHRLLLYTRYIRAYSRFLEFSFALRARLICPRTTGEIKNFYIYILLFFHPRAWCVYIIAFYIVFRAFVLVLRCACVCVVFIARAFNPVADFGGVGCVFRRPALLALRQILYPRII